MAAPDGDKQTHALRRRIALVLGVAVALLLLAVLPPLINVSRLQRRIAASMSISLGRPVHLDRIHLHLLPMPGFTIENLVVSEDPAFGNEPIIRANLVDVRLRPRSLWRRQVEVSSIHFKVDQFGSGPSVNLVRLPDGHWNLQGLLHSAARVDVAPTGEGAASASEAPRFPYIEATGARVNLKFGPEKTPFSLIDADLALWLPQSDSWQLRVEGKPVRTDTNLTDTGTVKLEGSLGRSPMGSGVVVDLKASWAHAPLGEASKLLTGADRGWRGGIAVDATLKGLLSAAQPAAGADPAGKATLTTKVHFEDLRRADFVPAKTLVVDVTCTGTLDLAASVLMDTACTLPTPEGAQGGGKIQALIARLPLTASAASTMPITLAVTNVDDAWLVDWARLFSHRVPVDERPSGVLNGSLRLNAAAGGLSVEKADLLGTVLGDLPSDSAGSATDPDRGPRAFVITQEGLGLGLQSFPLLRSAAGDLLLRGSLDQQGYGMHVQGVASAVQLQQLIALAPPLGDGGLLDAVTDFEQPLNLACTRAWGGLQVCASVAVIKPVRKRRR